MHAAAAFPRCAIDHWRWEVLALQLGILGQCRSQRLWRDSRLASKVQITEAQVSLCTDWFVCHCLSCTSLRPFHLFGLLRFPPLFSPVLGLCDGLGQAFLLYRVTKLVCRFHVVFQQWAADDGRKWSMFGSPPGDRQHVHGRLPWHFAYIFFGKRVRRLKTSSFYFHISFGMFWRRDVQLDFEWFK